MRPLHRLVTLSTLVAALGHLLPPGPALAQAPSPAPRERSRLGPFAPRPLSAAPRGGRPAAAAPAREVGRTPLRASPRPVPAPRASEGSRPPRRTYAPSERPLASPVSVPRPTETPLVLATRAPRSHRTVTVPAPLVALAKPQVDALVVGAGLTGMLAAHYLAEAGITHRVLTAGSRPGGPRRPLHYPHGVTAPDGLEPFSPGSPLLGVAEALRLPLGPKEPLFASLLVRGATHPVAGRTPGAWLDGLVDADERSAFDAWEARMTALAHNLRPGAVPADVMGMKGLTFAAWMQRRSGLSARTLHLLEASTRPAFGGAGWQHLSALDGLLEWQRFTARGAEVQRIDGGGRALLDALAERSGPELFDAGRRVTHLRRVPEGVEVFTLDAAGGEVHRYLARHVVLAVPPAELAPIAVTPAWPAAVVEAFSLRSPRDAVLAHVLVDTSASRFWRSGARSLLPLVTDGPLSVVRGGASEGRGYELLEVEWRGPEATSWAERPPSDVGVKLTAAFESIWPGFGAHIHHVAVVPPAGETPVAWPVGRSRLEAREMPLRQPIAQALHLAFEGLDGPHDEDAVTTAQRAVAQVAKALGKPWRPGASPRPEPSRKP